MTVPHYPVRRAGWLLVAAVLALLAHPDVTVAQTPTPAIESATLSLWPEYDDPGLLVIYSGDFGTNATFPLPVSFALPAGARDIQATVQDTDGGLLNQPFEQANGRLVYTLPGPRFHIEYYVDRPPSGAAREISYAFQPTYPIKRLDLQVQQPARASGFSLTPQADSSALGKDGLTYHRLARSNLAVNDSLSVTFRYTKSDPGFSVAPRSDATAGAARSAVPSAAAQGADPIIPYVLIGAGMALLAAAAAYYWLSRGRAAPVPARRGRSTGRRGGANAAAGRGLRLDPSGTAAFCPSCGRRYGQDDRFCAQCGTPRRD